MTSRPAYRESLREQLRVSGPEALEMLGGRVPLDPVVVLAALEAAGLLDDVTVGDDALRGLAASVRDRTAGSPAMHEVAQALEFECPRWPGEPGDALDREQELQQLVALAAVRRFLPSGYQLQVDELLDEAQGVLLQDVEVARQVGAHAAWLSDQLDLEPAHPVARFLSEVRSLEILEERPIREEAWDLAVARARNRLFPTPLTLLVDRLHRWWGDASAALELLVATPVRGAAMDAEVGRSLHHEVLWQDRSTNEELSLVVLGGWLALQWYGDRVARSVSLPSCDLAPVEGAVTPRWWLPAQMPDEQPILVIRFADGSTLEHDLSRRPIS